MAEYQDDYPFYEFTYNHYESGRDKMGMWFSLKGKLIIVSLSIFPGPGGGGISSYNWKRCKQRIL